MRLFGFWHGWGIVLFALVFVIPCWRIVRKAGFEGAWALLAFIPVVNIVALWIFAFMRWPNERAGS